MYQTMKIENLSKMISFFNFAVVEKISVDAVKHNFIAMKVDHMKGAVFFGKQVSSWFLQIRDFCTYMNIAIILTLKTSLSIIITSLISMFLSLSSLCILKLHHYLDIVLSEFYNAA